MVFEPISWCCVSVCQRPEFCCLAYCRGRNSADAPLRRAAAQVNELVRDCADGEHIVYAEIGEVLLDSNGRLSTALSPDWLHFNETGYAVLASRLEPVLDHILAGHR